MTDPVTPTDTEDPIPPEEDQTAEGAAEEEGPDRNEPWPEDDEE